MSQRYALRSIVHILEFAELPSHERHHRNNDVNVLRGMNLVNSPPGSPDFSEIQCPLWVHEKPREMTSIPKWEDYGIVYLDDRIYVYFDPLYRYSRASMPQELWDQLDTDARFILDSLELYYRNGYDFALDRLRQRGLYIMDRRAFDNHDYKGIFLGQLLNVRPH